jgi:hypothetical protein
MRNAKSNIFDFNYKSEINRTIFVTEFYYQAGEGGGNVYTLCINADRPDMPKVVNNSSDLDVYNYKYDFIIDNNGTKSELGVSAADFVVRLRDIVSSRD